jgi:hypothetical protein
MRENTGQSKEFLHAHKKEVNIENNILIKDLIAQGIIELVINTNTDLKEEA